MGVERKYERDIDLLLAEELVVSKGFAEWFLSKTKFADLTGSVVDVFVSKSNYLGESDLIAVYSVDGIRVALLIENKIDAQIQPEQAQRYRQRAAREVSQGTFADYDIVLCSPDAYRTTHTESAEFDRFLSYEAIADALGQIDQSTRGKYRAEFVRTASSRSANKWMREQDDATDRFWDAVYSLASREYPILEMKPLRLTKNSIWTTLRPHDFPTMPKYTCIYLKGNAGPAARKRCLVDLNFGNTTAHEFATSVKNLLPHDMTIHQTSKAAVIRIELPPFHVEEGIEIALPKVTAALSAAARMVTFYREFKRELSAAAIAATPLEGIVRNSG